MAASVALRVLPVYARPFNRAARADTTRWAEAPARLPALAVRQGQPTRFEGAATLLSAYLVCLEVWHQKAALAYAISVRVERTSPSPTRLSACRASQARCAPRARRLRCRAPAGATRPQPTSRAHRSAHVPTQASSPPPEARIRRPALREHSTTRRGCRCARRAPRVTIRTRRGRRLARAAVPAAPMGSTWWGAARQ